MDKDNPNKNFFLNIYKNIIKTDSGYSLQKAYEEDEDGNIRETSESRSNENNNSFDKHCFCCMHRDNEACMIRSVLENCSDNSFIPYRWVGKCDAYHPINPLNIIKSEEDMIDFMENTERFFGCPEEYEDYYGFKRKYDEETGEILETTREYYDRGGSFKNIPDKFPSVIYFDVVEYDRSIGWKLDWIYIGGNDV